MIAQDNIFVNYALTDQARDSRVKEVMLQLMWDHMPSTGTLYMGEQNKSAALKFTVPMQYR